MSAKSRAHVIEQGRQGIQEALGAWYESHAPDLIESSTELVFVTRVNRSGIVVGEFLEQETVSESLLPPEVPRPAHSGDPWGTWKLSASDWEKLAALSWGESQQELFSLLRERNNEPVRKSEIRLRDAETFRGLLRGFNTTCKRASNYRTNKTDGCGYRIKQVRLKSGLYAIYKLQR